MRKTIAILWSAAMFSAPFAGVSVQENIPWGNVTCYKITTSIATYYLDKIGAGLAGMVDKDNKDWISFDARVADEGGKFRGFPNAIHKKYSDGAFHPLNNETAESVTSITSSSNSEVIIKATCKTGEAYFVFTDNLCTFTITKIPTGYTSFWCLYEGTPNGDENPDNWWYYKSDNSTKNRGNTPTGSSDAGATIELSDPEWASFSHDNASRALLMVNHTPDDSDDIYYAMRGKMTVFGFGRRGATTLLKSLPHSFTICFKDGTDYNSIKSYAEEIAGMETSARPRSSDFSVKMNNLKTNGTFCVLNGLNRDHSSNEMYRNVYSIDGRILGSSDIERQTTRLLLIRE